MKTMRDINLLENTIIIFIGDHGKIKTFSYSENEMREFIFIFSGWSLGEHAEWGKYSNFDLAVRVPFLLYDPQLTTTKSRGLNHGNAINYSRNDSLVSDHLVELVDIFPTLCDLTGLPIPPMCGPIPTPQKLCTEGESLVPIIKGLQSYEGKSGVFSQYPRPSEVPTHNSDKPRLADIRIMGYTVRTKRYRYTEWVGFEDLTAKWEQVVGVEMYDHHIDPVESVNLAGREGLADVQRQLQTMLRAGWRAAHSKAHGNL
jgi:iduronate 2-sulfatase